MAEVITMPRLSDTMEIGKVIKWYKKIGDKVSEGDILAEIETDKAIQDFEVDVKGVILYIGVEQGENVKVDDIIAIIGEYDEDISSLISKKSNDIKNFSEKFELNICKKNLQEKVIDTSKEQISKIEQESEYKRICISPLAKKIATKKGVILNNIIGTGENGRIIKRDIEKYEFISSNIVIEKEKNSDNTTSSVILSKKQEVPHSSIRRITAKNLTKSKFTAPHYYVTMEIDMKESIQSRKIINKEFPNNKISFNDLIVKAISIALRDHSQINTSWTEDKIIYHSDINIGVAVATGEGLIVPVIFKTDQKSLYQISEEIKDKVLRSRDRKIQAKEIEGSTFTISNLGMFGVNSFTSIINYPNSCILSVGTITEKPIIKNNNIIISSIMKITLACDHRLIDGSIAGMFLQTCKKLLENPILML